MNVNILKLNVMGENIKYYCDFGGFQIEKIQYKISYL